MFPVDGSICLTKKRRTHSHVLEEIWLLTSTQSNSTVYPSFFSFYFSLGFFVPTMLSPVLLFPPFCRSGKINNFNLEEEAFGWSVSHYPQRKKIQDQLKPFLHLYETATAFLNQYEQWVHGPLSGVNPDKVPQFGKLDTMTCVLGCCRIYLCHPVRYLAVTAGSEYKASFEIWFSLKALTALSSCFPLNLSSFSGFIHSNSTGFL